MQLVSMYNHLFLVRTILFDYKFCLPCTLIEQKAVLNPAVTNSACFVCYHKPLNQQCIAHSVSSHDEVIISTFCVCVFLVYLLLCCYKHFCEVKSRFGIHQLSTNDTYLRICNSQ